MSKFFFVVTGYENIVELELIGGDDELMFFTTGGNNDIRYSLRADNPRLFQTYEEAKTCILFYIGAQIAALKDKLAELENKREALKLL